MGYLPVRKVVMTTYTIENYENGAVTLRYPDGSYAIIPVMEGITVDELDHLAYEFGPKPVVAEKPSFITLNETRTAVKRPDVEEPSDFIDYPQYIQDRIGAYGTAEAQLEWITENGLESWQAEVAKIKALYPAPEGE
jgi:hypothetical protein